MQPDQYRILMTDENLSVLGDPIACWTAIDYSLRWNEPGSGFFKAPAHAWLVEQIVPGSRAVLIRQTWDGAATGIFASGPVEKLVYERSDDGENSGVGNITVNFADDLAKVVARLVYPDPAQTAETQTTDSWSFTGNAEVGLRTLVDVNAGPSALAARQIPQLVLGSLTTVGTTVTVNAQRMQPLGEVARQIAEVGGGLGFRTRQVGSQIRFEVFNPPDLSGQVRFGFNYGNMKYIAWDVTGPTATTVIAGGQGEGTDRNLYERNNAIEEAAWGRYEKLASTAGGDSAEAQAAGDRMLGQSVATTRLATNVVDTGDQRYGVDYQLGDMVAVENAPGSQIVDVVRTVHLQAWPTAGSLITPYVGDQSAQPRPEWAKRLAELEERLGTLERVVVPAVP